MNARPGLGDPHALSGLEVKGQQVGPVFPPSAQRFRPALGSLPGVQIIVPRAQDDDAPVVEYRFVLAGVMPAEADQLIAYARDELDLPVVGLMCIPPVDEEPALHFAFLREIARRNGLQILSMGMSADFETAIRFGATHVRVGTAIFGPRPKP